MGMVVSRSLQPVTPHPVSCRENIKKIAGSQRHANGILKEHHKIMGFRIVSLRWRLPCHHKIDAKPGQRYWPEEPEYRHIGRGRQ